jgi:putative copper export protein/methionine-rich copper-binding protein CopC
VLGRASVLSRRRACAVLVGLLALMVVGAGEGGASAHGWLEGSSPEDGETLADPPPRIDLWFSEPALSKGARVEVHDADGSLVVSTSQPDAGDPAQGVHREAALLDDGVHLAVLDLPPLPTSVYEVRWTATSAVDFHETSGTVVFGVGETATMTGSTDDGFPPPLGGVVVGWVDLAGLTMLCGGVLLSVGLLPWLRRRQPASADLVEASARSVVFIAAAAGMVSAAATILTISSQSRSGLLPGPGSSWAEAGTPLTWEAVRAGATVVLAALLLTRARRLPRPPKAPGAAPALILPALLVLVVFARAGTSHAQDGPVSRAVVASHELAATAWLGGLAVLVLLTVRHVRSGSARHPMTQLWRGFGLVAVASVTVLILTGMLLTGHQVASLDAWLTTPYGITLLAKLALVAAALTLGLTHALRLHPWVLGGRYAAIRRRASDAGADEHAGPGRSALIEAVVGLGVILGAAVLAVSQPARGPDFVADREGTDHVTVQQAGLLVNLSVRPNRPGRNVAFVEAVNLQRPPPGEVTGVTLTIGSGPSVRLRPEEVGDAEDPRWRTLRWRSVVELHPGDAPVDVTVERAGVPPVSVGDTWVTATESPRPRLVSQQPLQPWALTAAILFACASLALTAALVRRRARWAFSAGPPDLDRLPTSPVARSEGSPDLDLRRRGVDVEDSSVDATRERVGVGR